MPSPSRRTTSGSRNHTDDSSPAEGSVATPDAGLGASQADYAQFIWQKLNSIDGHLKDLAERHGRLDEKIAGMSGVIEGKTSPIQKSVEKLEGKVSKLETTVRWATAVIVVSAFVASGLMGLYKLIESHITWH